MVEKVLSYYMFLIFLFSSDTWHVLVNEERGYKKLYCLLLKYTQILLC